MVDYDDLSPSQFEALVVALCTKILGEGVQGFSAGKDGGRDARFHGTANKIPSESEPWTGIVIVQAKHTSDYNSTFGDPDFYSPSAKSSVLGDELTRINKLRSAKDLDHYMLFSNRRMSGGVNTALVNTVSSVCSISSSSIMFCGVETMDRLVRTYPDIERIAALSEFKRPLIVDPMEMAELVEVMAAKMDVVTTKATISSPVERVKFKEKNTLNKMSDGFANELRGRFLKDSATIKEVLENPENTQLLRWYEAAVCELQCKIIAFRHEFESFDKIHEHILGLFFGRDPVLRRNKPLTRALLFYMYWNCDIGVSKNDHPETE